MKVKPDKIVRCGNYRCRRNYDGHCAQDIITLDQYGYCALERPNILSEPTQKAESGSKNPILSGAGLSKI